MDETDEKKEKSYKTELIVALITACTAISVAVITNWEKIFPKPTSAVVENPITTLEDSEKESKYDFGGNSVIIDAINSAQEKSKLGWYVELIEMSTIQVDSTHGFTVDLDKYHKYELEVFCDNSTLNFRVEFYCPDLKTITEKGYLNEDTVLEINVVVANLNRMFISVENQKVATTFSLLLVSKSL